MPANQGFLGPGPRSGRPGPWRPRFGRFEGAGPVATSAQPPLTARSGTLTSMYRTRQPLGISSTAARASHFRSPSAPSPKRASGAPRARRRRRPSTSPRLTASIRPRSSEGAAPTIAACAAPRPEAVRRGLGAFDLRQALALDVDAGQQVPVDRDSDRLPSLPDHGHRQPLGDGDRELVRDAGVGGDRGHGRESRHGPDQARRRHVQCRHLQGHRLERGVNLLGVHGRALDLDLARPRPARSRAARTSSRPAAPARSGPARAAAGARPQRPGRRSPR